jgi:hypothetical protein
MMDLPLREQGLVKLEGDYDWDNVLDYKERTQVELGIES